MLEFSNIIQELEFSGNLLIYLLGLPFVIIIIKNMKDPRKELLLSNVSKHKNDI